MNNQYKYTPEILNSIRFPLPHFHHLCMIDKSHTSRKQKYRRQAREIKSTGAQQKKHRLHSTKKKNGTHVSVKSSLLLFPLRHQLVCVCVCHYFDVDRVVFHIAQDSFMCPRRVFVWRIVCRLSPLSANKSYHI